MDKVNLDQKFALFSQYFQPKIVGELNGQHVKLVKVLMCAAPRGRRGVTRACRGNIQVPFGCLRTTSVLRPRAASSVPIPVAGSTTQPPCSTAKPSCDSTTARVSSVIRPRRVRRLSRASRMFSRPITLLPSTTKTALGSYRAIKASTSPRLKACWKRVWISAGRYAGI